MEIKFGMVKSLEFFFLQSYSMCFVSEIFVCFGLTLFNLALTFAAHLEKTLFLLFLRSLLITSLITLSLEKDNNCFGKKYGSPEFWNPKSVRTLVI